LARNGAARIYERLSTRTAVTSFFATYPYLFNALLMLGICAIGMAVFPGHRIGAAISGLLALPAGIMWPISLVPAYWTPRVVLGVGRVALEDLIWAFATGSLAWHCAVTAVEPNTTRSWHPPGMALRYAIVGLIGAAVFMPLWLGGVKVMATFTMSVSFLVLCLLAIRRDAWKMAAAGAIGFGLINALAMQATFAICPDYYAQMSPGAFSGLMIGGLAIEEVHWAIATGAAWPLVVVYVFDVRKPAESKPGLTT
jgi:hypothetical protein